MSNEGIKAAICKLAALALANAAAWFIAGELRRTGLMISSNR
jgi:hypothetical protein